MQEIDGKLRQYVFANTGLAAGGAGGRLPLEDIDNWSFRFRVHRDFYP